MKKLTYAEMRKKKLLSKDMNDRFRIVATNARLYYALPFVHDEVLQGTPKDLDAKIKKSVAEANKKRKPVPAKRVVEEAAVRAAQPQEGDVCQEDANADEDDVRLARNMTKSCDLLQATNEDWTKAELWLIRDLKGKSIGRKEYDDYVKACKRAGQPVRTQAALTRKNVELSKEAQRKRAWTQQEKDILNELKSDQTRNSYENFVRVCHANGITETRTYQAYRHQIRRKDD